MENRIPNPRRSQSGVGLIEVMIAVLVLGVGLLGIAALQAVTLSNTGSSTERAQAVMQAYTALDMLRANRLGAKAGNFDSAWSKGNATPNPDLNTVDGWKSNLLATVGPSTEGMVACEVTGAVTQCTVGVRWNEERATGGSSAQEFEITSRL